MILNNIIKNKSKKEKNFFMATTSKREIINLSNLSNSSDLRKTFFSIESIRKFLNLNRNKKNYSQKMATTVFTENITTCKHHVISSFHTGDMVCDQCGYVVGKIYDVREELLTNATYFKRLLKKYKKTTNIWENLDLIFSVKKNLELSDNIINRSLDLFLQANEKMKNVVTRFYALSCIYYSLKEASCSILCKEILELCHKNVNRCILKKFYNAYYNLTEKLELKKLASRPDYYLYHLSKEFSINRQNENMAKIILSKIIRFLPANKQMNSGIAAGVFYVNSKMNNLKISQKQIADMLKISRGAACEYTKDVSSILSVLYFKKRKIKFKSKDFQYLKLALEKLNPDKDKFSNFRNN